MTLRPTVGEEFSGGPALPSGWSSGTWESQGGGAGGSATVTGGALHVNGAFADTSATYGSGRSLEFRANFGGGNFSHVGFTDNFNDNWAFFSIRGDGSINARTNVGGAQQDTQLPSALIGSAHNYRIEWDASEVRYYVDGSLVVTHSANFGSTQMRPAASDFNAGGSDVAVDWLHMSPYPGAGSFTSRVLDAGQSADWGALSWIANTPTGTSVVLNVRTGNTPTPDGSWSSFTPINANGGDIPGNSRYLQYRADLSSTDQGTTPALSQVTASYNAGADTTPPTIVGRTPARERDRGRPRHGRLGAVQRADGSVHDQLLDHPPARTGRGHRRPGGGDLHGQHGDPRPQRRPRPERRLQRHRCRHRHRLERQPARGR